MTSEPRHSDQLRPEDDDRFEVDDATGDDLDQTFAEVESEVGHKTGDPAKPKPGTVHAGADEFSNMSIDDVDDVFVIDDEEGGVAWTAELRADSDKGPQQQPAHHPGPFATPAPTDAAESADTEDFQDEFAGEFDDLSVSAPSHEPLRAARDMAGAPGLPHDETVEDDLFAAPTSVEASEQFGTDAEQFTENDGTTLWGGSRIDARDIGINANEGDDRPTNREDDDNWSVTSDQEQDIEIVEDEDATAVGDFAIVDGDPAEQFGIQPLDEEEVSAPASGVWEGSDSATIRSPSTWRSTDQDTVAPAADAHAGAELEADAGEAADSGGDQEYDPIYGDGTGAPADQEQVQEETAATSEADYSDHEAAYVDQTRHAPVLVGAPLRPRRRGVMSLAAAAALILCGVTAGFAFMQPEWLGLQATPALIDRALIARPGITIEVNAPPAPVDDVVTDPAPIVATPDPVVHTDPVAHTDPRPDPTPPINPGPDPVVSQTSPEPRPDPTAPPTHTEPPVTPPVAVVEPPPTPTPAPTPAPVPSKPVATGTDVIRVGEDLQIGRATQLATRPRVHHLAEGLSTGSQAFAQLRNMNFFLGRVKAMDSSFLTLDLTPGEITIAFDELNAVVPLASEEYRALQGKADGFVKLTNRNKLFGKILNNSLADNVVLEVQQNHVVIPRSSIEEVGSQTRTSVQVMQDEDAEWIKAMLQRQAMPKAAPKRAEPSVKVPSSGGAAAPPRDKR